MNIIIIGDIMLDINQNSVIERNASESVIPIYDILDVNYILGGAANVALNLTKLETNVELISVIGNDQFGKIIKNILQDNGVNNKLFIDNDRKTTQKNRIFLDH
jgi:D-beta-D-heptose 7-phosphate kinase/D-beta-D-heptose 1-phosphate adenosyltransferase